MMWIEITPAHVYFRPEQPTPQGEVLWRWQQDNLFYGDWSRTNIPELWFSWERKGYASMECICT